MRTTASVGGHPVHMMVCPFPDGVPDGESAAFDGAAAVGLAVPAVVAGGPDVSEELIREALHPYDGLFISTKAGLTRPGPGQEQLVWVKSASARGHSVSGSITSVKVETFPPPALPSVRRSAQSRWPAPRHARI